MAFKTSAIQFGNVRFMQLDGEDHYLPMTKPATLAGIFKKDLSEKFLTQPYKDASSALYGPSPFPILGGCFVCLFYLPCCWW